MDTARFTNYRREVVENCSKVIVGKEKTIELVLICFMCSGHVLLEDVPGTGKTMLLRAFSATIGGNFKRIQFTPDLLPSDLVGINFFNRKSDEFEFRPGPLFANIVLADEINRATPRTQSALLEAMEEGQITVDGDTRALEEPFMVMATQNPIESYGTFPLPEAQIDRFFMRLSMGYMEREQERSVMSRASTKALVSALEKKVSDEDTAFIRSEYVNVRVNEAVTDYIMDIIEHTRSESTFLTGVSTRGAIALYKASQAMAALSGRDFVIPEDVKEVAPYVLAHRLNSTGSARAKLDYIEGVLKKVKVPLEEC